MVPLPGLISPSSSGYSVCIQKMMNRDWHLLNFVSCDIDAEPLLGAVLLMKMVAVW